MIGDMVGFGSYSLALLLRHEMISAKDYVEGMWMMLQQEHPEDFVLATGETHPVREFVVKAFEAAGIKLR